MTPEKVKELRNGNKIIAVAGKLGLLKRPIDENTQTSYNVHCPNVSRHTKGDHKPSLALLPRKNRYHCYGCDIDGDVIDLVKITNNISFQEAIKWLDPNAELISPNNRVAKDYLREKGLTQETCDKFKVWIGKTNDEGIDYECIYFPIPTGKKYRLFGCPNHKYKNGVRASACIFKTIENPTDDIVVLCEGEFDAMAGWQNTGYPFWSSTGGAGTFLRNWVEEFKRFKQIIIGFDNDEAGRIGATNVVNILVNGGIERNKIIQIEVPELLGKDWCDYFVSGMTKKDFDESIDIWKNKGGIG